MTEKADLEWWSSREPHNGIFNSLEVVAEEEQTRRDLSLHFLRLYGDRNLASLDPSDFGSLGLATEMLKANHLRYNVVKAVCDTATSRVGKNKPKAAFLTSGASWAMQRQSKRLEKYVEGTFFQTKYYAKSRMQFRDATIVGSGLKKFFPERTKLGWRVGCERVFPWEVVVDLHDARYGQPRQMFHVKWVDKRVLRALFSKNRGLKDKLEFAQNEELGTNIGETLADQVKLVEAWRLPSGPGAGDGKHVFAVNGATLFSEEWDEDWFPFSVYHWSKPVVGYWGTGIAKEINGVQVEINRLLEKLQKAYHLFANPWVAVHRSSKIVKSHITNEIGRLLEYEGSIPPQVVTHNPISPQLFTHLAQLKADAHDLPGVSQTAAQNRKPADLESGEALRQWNDIEDTRHADPALAYEEMVMDDAQVIVGMSRRMAQRKDDRGKSMEPSIMAIHRRRSRKWVEVIKWDEVDIDETSYVMQIYPTSTLPSTPAGRTATVEQWLRAGLIDKDEARYLLEFPDLEAHQDLSPAFVNTEVVLDAIEQMVDEGHPQNPEPFLNLDRVLALVQSAYMRAKLDRVPEKRLELVRRYISATIRLIDIRDGRVPQTVGAAAPAQPAAPVQPIAAGTPQADAGPPPAGLPPDAGILAALQQAS